MILQNLRYVPVSCQSNILILRACEVIPAQTITDPPPNESFSPIKTEAYLSPGLLHTRRRSSDLERLKKRLI